MRLALVILTFCCVNAPLLVAAAVMTDGFLPPAQASATAGTLYVETLNKMASGDLDGAEAGFEELLTRNAKDTRAMLGFAEVEYQRQNAETAFSWIQKAVAAEPDNPHVLASLGRYQAARGDYANAEPTLQKAIKMDAEGTMVRPRMDLADIYATGLKKLDAAVELYEDALKINPEHAGAHYALGVVLARLERTDEALPELMRASELQAHNPLPAVALSRVYAVKGDTEQELKWLARAIEIQPTRVQARNLRGDLYLAQGEYTKARTDFQAIVDVVPEHALAHLKIGASYERDGQIDKAMAAYQSAVSADPAFATAYNNLAWLSAENKLDLAQAEAWAHKAIELGPATAHFHDTLGWVYRAQGTLDKARETLTTAVSMDGATAEMYYHLGVVYREQAAATTAVQDVEAINTQC